MISRRRSSPLHDLINQHRQLFGWVMLLATSWSMLELIEAYVKAPQDKRWLNWLRIVRFAIQLMILLALLPYLTS